jgi:hypothetical protein
VTEPAAAGTAPASEPAASEQRQAWVLPDGERDRSAETVDARLSGGLDDADVVLQEAWSESDPAVRPFDLPAMTGAPSNLGTFEVMVNEPDTVALADIGGIGDAGPDLAFGVATTSRFLAGGQSDIALGLYCWDSGSRNDGPDRVSSRYEMALIPDGDRQRLIVLRRAEDADAAIMLIDEPVAVPVAESARIVLACRRAGAGAEIIAGAASTDDEGAPAYVAAVDPDPLPAGRAAGLLTSTRPGSRPGEVAVFGPLTVFDANVFDLG